jgi:hypothetical protein
MQISLIEKRKYRSWLKAEKGHKTRLKIKMHPLIG